MFARTQRILTYLIVGTVLLITVSHFHLYDEHTTSNQNVRAIDVSRLDAESNPTVHNAGDVAGGHVDGGLIHLVFNQQPLEKSKNIQLNQHDKSIAIGGGLRMTNCGDGSRAGLGKTAFFNRLIPSFCKTASLGYTYYVIFVYDEVDPCLSRPDVKESVMTYFNEMVKKKCPKGVVKGLSLRSCPYSGAPAWAQSEAMMDAYRMNITYFYR